MRFTRVTGKERQVDKRPPLSICLRDLGLLSLLETKSQAKLDLSRIGGGGRTAEAWQG